MHVVYKRCCGLDIHKRTVVACVLVPEGKQLRTFSTMTQDLLELRDWLQSLGVTHVAMESTGVYWKPVWNLLEGSFELALANAGHIKAVPGRKTDVKDAEWIADLLRHGLIRGSFVPDRVHRELRELSRYRTSLIQERTAEVNRVQKVLEGANIKLGNVASDVMGVSARAMLEMLVAGSTNAAQMAELAKGSLRSKLPELEQALQGVLGEHQRFLLAQQLAHIDFLDETIARLDAEIEERMRPFEGAVELLDEIPGVGKRVAQVMVAEIGTDMSRFPSARHLASWAGMCPGNDESAGKKRSSKTRKGNKWLRAALVEAAHAAGRKQNCYLSAQYHRLVSRRGKKRAAVAVGHSILVIAYHLLWIGARYEDLGGNYFEHSRRERVERRLVSRLESMGYKVTLQPAA